MVHFKQHIVRLLPWLLLAALTGTVFSCVHDASVSGEPDDSFTPIACDAPAILYHGRIDHRDPPAPVFDWPAVPVLCGSFRKEPLSDWLREIVEEKNAGGENGYYWYAFSPLQPDEYGDDHHANAKAHLRRAQEILPVITRATGRKSRY
jgi:hypothetical protein